LLNTFGRTNGFLYDTRGSLLCCYLIYIYIAPVIGHSALRKLLVVDHKLVYCTAIMSMITKWKWKNVCGLTWFASLFITRVTLASAGISCCRVSVCLSQVGVLLKRPHHRDSRFLMPKISAKLKRGSPPTEVPNANVGHFAYKTFRLLDTSPTTWTLCLLDISPTGHFAYSLDSSPTKCEHKRMKMCDIHCVPNTRAQQ